MTHKTHNSPDLKTEADKGAYHDRCIHNVPQVAEVRARVEQDSEVHDLEQHLHSEDARERVVEVV